jgi:hypothetical protein
MTEEIKMSLHKADEYVKRHTGYKEGDLIAWRYLKDKQTLKVYKREKPYTPCYCNPC